jgi:20S proteasome alpha/beta subunit
MADSHTVVAALKFQGGVVIAADSQVSDDIVGVRWLMEKPEQVKPHPLVVAFSGSHGRGLEAKLALCSAGIEPKHFKSPERIQKVMDAVLQPVYEGIRQNSKPPFKDFREITLTGLAVFWAGGEPHILERELNGDSYPHDCFHAVGSGGATAYAVYRTLGGQRLTTVDEPKALMAILRIIKTCIGVEYQGVSEPIIAYVIADGRVRQLPRAEIDAHLEAVERWERRQQERFFAGELEL